MSNQVRPDSGRITTKKIQPTERKAIVGAALVLLLLIMVFLARALFPGSGNVIMGIDVRGQFLSWFHFIRTSIAEGSFPLWNPNQLGGYPFFANPQVALFYPPAWFAILLPTEWGISLFIALHMWLSGLGMLLLVRYLGAAWLGSILATITWSLSHLLALRIFAGHLGIIATVAWLPWLLLTTTWSIRRRDLLSAAVVGAVFSLATLAGNITALFYVSLGWLMYAGYLCLVTKRCPAVLRQMAVAISVGLGLSMVQLLPTLVFALNSSRATDPGFSFSGSYSIPLYQLTSLVNPEYFGSPFSVLGYWGAEFYWEVTYYIGILPLIGLLLILRKPSRLSWFYLSLIIAALLIAIGPGSFLYRLFYQVLPPFRLLRAPSRALILAVFAACGLVAETVTHFEHLPRDQRIHSIRQRMPWFILLIVVVLVGSALISARQFTALTERTISAWIRSQAFGWPFMLVLLIAASIALLAYFQTDHARARRRNNLAFSLVLIALLDAFIFGAKYVTQTATGPDSTWVEAKRMIGDSKGRILPWHIEDIQLQNDATRVELPSVHGYNPLQIASYRDLISEAANPDSVIYDLLNAQFLLSKSELREDLALYKDLELLNSSGSVWIYRRTGALPAARLVAGIEIVDDRDMAIQKILSESFDPKAVVILEETPPCKLPEIPGPVAGTTRVVDRDANRWLVETGAPSAAILVISENNYPGWQVRVDGEPVAPLTAYGTLRAVCLPPGEHLVEWVFRPASLLIGSALTLTTLVVVGVLLIHAYAQRKNTATAIR